MHDNAPFELALNRVHVAVFCHIDPLPAPLTRQVGAQKFYKTIHWSTTNKEDNLSLMHYSPISLPFPWVQTYIMPVTLRKRI